MNGLKKLSLIFALTMMWSPSFLFIKLAVREIPPLTTVSLRVLLAAIFLSVILLIKGRSFPKSPMFWFHSAMMAFFSSVLPFYSFCCAEQTIDSALAAIINGTTPMFTAFLAHCFIHDDRLSIQKVIGMVFSAVGLVLLFLPNILSGLQGNLTGMFFAVTAAVSYAVSFIYAKKYLTQQPTFVAPTAQILLSAMMLCPFALWFESPWTLNFPSLYAVGGILGMAIFGTTIAFVIYYKLLEVCGPTALSMVACFFPVGGMFLGYFFLGENITWLGIAAAFLILCGVLVVNNLITVPRLLRKRAIEQL